jgi:hypothetical protein
MQNQMARRRDHQRRARQQDDRPNVFVTVMGLDGVEAWVPGARTRAEAHAVHEGVVAKYRMKARALAMALATTNRGRRTA